MAATLGILSAGCMTGPTAPAPFHLVKVDADGTVSPTLTLPLLDFATDAQDALWVAGGSTVTKLAPDGTTALTLPIAAAYVALGDVYAGDGQTVSKIVP